MRLRRRIVLADLSRPGLTEQQVRDRSRPLSSAIAQVVSGATAFSHGTNPSFDEVVDRKMGDLKFIQLPEKESANGC